MNVAGVSQGDVAWGGGGRCRRGMQRPGGRRGREGSQVPQAGKRRPHLAISRKRHCPARTNVEVVVGSKPPRFLFLRRRHPLRPSPPMAKCAAIDPRGPTAFGHTCFVPSRAKPTSVISASDIPVASTNLKRDLGNTEDSLCNWVQLSGVNILLVLDGRWTTYLCEDSAIFNRPAHGLLYRSAHQWSVFL